MQWVRPQGISDTDARYAITSECGRYAIAKIGYTGGHYYEVRRTRLHEDGPHLVQTIIKTADEAKRIALADQGD